SIQLRAGTWQRHGGLHTNIGAPVLTLARYGHIHRQPQILVPPQAQWIFRVNFVIALFLLLDLVQHLLLTPLRAGAVSRSLVLRTLTIAQGAGVLLAPLLNLVLVDGHQQIRMMGNTVTAASGSATYFQLGAGQAAIGQPQLVFLTSDAQQGHGLFRAYALLLP